jgi:hypothetical protein
MRKHYFPTGVGGRRRLARDRSWNVPAGAQELAAFRPHCPVLILAVAHLNEARDPVPCAVRRLSH